MKNRMKTSLPVLDPSRSTVGTPELEQFFVGVTNAAQSSIRHVVTQSELEQFFTTVDHLVDVAEKQQRRLDKRLATGFNVFRLIEPDENKLSDILANLLDPKGTRGQGDLFLRLLFEKLELGAGAVSTENAVVQREALTHGISNYRRRIDVLVKAGTFLAIENKLDSLEQPDQIKDYLEHLRQEAGDRENCLIYLTPDGRQPKSLDPDVVQQYRERKTLYCWSNQKELRTWLEACRNRRSVGSEEVAHVWRAQTIEMGLVQMQLLRRIVQATDASAFTFRPRERATSQTRARLAEA